MAENPHYKELLQLLNEFEVEYLIVGGFAVMKYGEPRIYQRPRCGSQFQPNSVRVVEALRQFGAPLDHDRITPSTFSGTQVVYQIGIAPVRIDILTEITGVNSRRPGIEESQALSSVFQCILFHWTTSSRTKEL